MKVLLAEDDRHIREGLHAILAAEGYQTIMAGDGREALARFDGESPHFVLLDIMMPGIERLRRLPQIRARNPDVPIIFISAKSEEIDRVLGLELGADDFIVKPFGVKEVVARIRAVTRRCLRTAAPAQAPPFTMVDLEVFPAELRARRGQHTFELSLREVGILRLLHENTGRVVDRDTFFNRLWGLDHVPNSRTLDQQISKLRRRIELDPTQPRLIPHRTRHRLPVRGLTLQALSRSETSSPLPSPCGQGEGKHSVGTRDAIRLIEWIVRPLPGRGEMAGVGEVRLNLRVLDAAELGRQFGL